MHESCPSYQGICLRLHIAVTLVEEIVRKPVLGDKTIQKGI